MSGWSSDASARHAARAPGQDRALHRAAPAGVRPARARSLRLLVGMLVLALLAPAAVARESSAQGAPGDEVLVRFAPGADPAERAAARRGGGRRLRGEAAAPRAFRWWTPIRGARPARWRPARALRRRALRRARRVPQGLRRPERPLRRPALGTRQHRADASATWPGRSTRTSTRRRRGTSPPGTAAVTVGILDTGVDYTHPDLAPNIWANPGESGAGRETNGIDDDANGYVDDYRGWDWAGDNATPRRQRSRRRALARHARGRHGGRARQQRQWAWPAWPGTCRSCPCGCSTRPGEGRCPT